MARKITITMPDGVYERLEGDRGLVPRATYIQLLIMQGPVNDSFSSSFERQGPQQGQQEGREGRKPQRGVGPKVVGEDDLPAPKRDYAPQWKGGVK